MHKESCKELSDLQLSAFRLKPAKVNVERHLKCLSLNEYNIKVNKASDTAEGFCNICGFKREDENNFLDILNQCKEYNSVAESVNSKIRSFDISAVTVDLSQEDKVLAQEAISGLLQPATLLDEPKCILEIVYISPAGRNHYLKKIELDMHSVLAVVHNMPKDVEVAKDMATVERNKMTPSLRYEVLKRDGFRCVLCGRGQEDGAVLEVDHIIPVSKGGKTEMSNLRTLCRDCNRGKAAKLE